MERVHYANQKQVGFTHGSLFSGIGGFDLAAQWMGWENVFHCEWNEFGRKVLHHYWPNAISYGDITKTDFTIHKGDIDILTGGFPCQPYSQAGKRLGKEDDRHLWPEMLRAIRGIRPKWIVGENVLGIVNWNGGLVFDEVQTDLEAEGYEVQPYVLPAAGVNAPHQRYRVWFVAYRTDARIEGVQREGADSIHGFTSTPNTISTRGRENIGQSKRKSNEFIKDGIPGNWQAFPVESPICGGDDGLPTELDGITFPKWRNESIKAYGNAVVPQVVLQIFKAIEEYEQTHQ